MKKVKIGTTEGDIAKQIMQVLDDSGIIIYTRRNGWTLDVYTEVPK
jgi:hypothetical protein